MIETYTHLWSLINWNIFSLSAIVFLFGVLAAPFIIKWQLDFFIKYPIWIYQNLMKFIKYNKDSRQLFILIFSLNTFSLFLSFISGFGMILPFLLAFFTGLNISIISYKIGGRIGILTLLFNPVALLELPAAWFAISAGIELGQSVYQNQYSAETVQIFWYGVDKFVFLVIPLLFFAALLETYLIKKYGEAPNSGNDPRDPELR